MILVGATNVGSININLLPGLTTNVNKDAMGNIIDHDVNFKVRSGDEIGMFKMGSTVVLVFEAPKDVKMKIGTGDFVKFGQTFATFN